MNGTRWVAWMVSGVALMAGAAPAFGQDAAARGPLAEGNAALEACMAAAAAGDHAAATEGAGRADALLREAEKGAETAVQALSLRARVITGCRIPGAGMMQQGQLIEQANGLLEQALRIDPRSWLARFSLGMNHFYTPEFLGRTGLAVEHLERLMADHEATDPPIPVLANAYLHLGDLYLRQSRKDDAVRTWRTGAARFPGDSTLGARIEEHGGGRDERRSPAGGASAEGVTEGGSEPSQERRTNPPAAYALAPIVVESGSYSVGDARTGTPLTRMDVYSAPGGTADVLQVFQMMPGVTRATEGSDLYVRGGDPAEAPVFVDGARLFHAGTFETLNGSIFGVLDPSTMRKAYFSSGGFSARYGNALSGVLDVETDGRPEGFTWRTGANLVSAGGTVRAPLGTRTGAWASGTFTDTRALLYTQGRGDEYPDAPSSWNGIAGLVFQPGRSLEVRASALAESDHVGKEVDALGYRGVFEGRGSTRLITTSGRWLDPSGGRTARLSVGATTRSNGFQLGVLDRERTDRGIQSRLDLETATSGGTRIRAGLEAAALDATMTGREPTGEELAPGSPSRVLPDSTADAHHLGGYLESEVRLSERMAVVAGARADRLPGEDEWQWDPRLALAYQVGDWTVRAGTGVFHQGRWRVRYELPDEGRPAGVARRARHFALGAQREGPLSLRAEAFVKRYDEYVDDGRSGPLAVAGDARGLDVLARWTGAGRMTGWLSWSLLDAEVELEDGRTVSAPADVTHTMTAVARIAVADAWELGLTGRLATGRPYTPIIGRDDSPSAERPVAPIYGELYGERLPGYGRLDARITRAQTLRSGLLVVYLEALNVLDRRNVMGYTYDTSYMQRTPIESFFADRTLVLGMEAHF